MPQTPSPLDGFRGATAHHPGRSRVTLLLRAVPICRNSSKIASWSSGELLIDGRLQRDTPSRRALADEDLGVLERRREVEVRELEIHPSRFDLRQIENVVDQGQQVRPEA
jgi:hypothetical protein